MNSNCVAQVCEAEVLVLQALLGKANLLSQSTLSLGATARLVTSFVICLPLYSNLYGIKKKEIACNVIKLSLNWLCLMSINWLCLMFDTAVLFCKSLWMLQECQVFFFLDVFCTYERCRIARQAALLTGDVIACYKKNYLKILCLVLFFFFKTQAIVCILVVLWYIPTPGSP